MRGSSVSSVRSPSLSTANSPLRPAPCPSFTFRKARLNEPAARGTLRVRGVNVAVLNLG